jgi:transcriptional regulator with GAF, ATPase, and Fis domain
MLGCGGNAMHWLVSVLDIAKLLLAEDEKKTPELLLHRVLDATGAERGFILLWEESRYVQKCQVRFEPERLSREERRFSRSLVREVLDSGEAIYSPSVAADPRFAHLESAQALSESCVLVAPLRARGSTYGAVYLEHCSLRDAFSDESRRLLKEFGELAGLFIRRYLEHEELRRRNRELERNLFQRNGFECIVTADAAMLELLRTVAQVAASDAAVLVHGETGTGKELVARALHLNSLRAEGPFVSLHCSALPASVLESELFGHTRGAFTGAQGERKGRIAMAHRGTLFLDEVAEIPFELQAKLLRFLQFGEIQRVGSDQTETLDVRVVAATHQDLQELARQKRFREDLYFRLDVVGLELPALRERAGDIPLLLEHFLRRYWQRDGEPRWSEEAERALLAYGYPGNVRELENIVRRACLLARGSVLGKELLPRALAETLPEAGMATFVQLTNEELKRLREAAVEEVERRFLGALLQHCSGNVSLAARQAQMNRSQLHKMLSRYR